jgi:hypothetical protein
MTLFDTKLNFTKKISVRITGSWQEGTRRQWQGLAVSSEPVVVLNLSRACNKIEWSKSERGNPEGQEVRLILSPYDKDKNDVQVRFIVGWGVAEYSCITLSDTYLPEILFNKEITTGEIVKMFLVEGNKTIEFYALFLAASDVEVGRNGLWHVRKKYQKLLPRPFDKILTYGRSGKIQQT